MKLVRLNKITKIPYDRYGVTIAVLALSPTTILACQYPDQRSNLVKYLSLVNQLNKYQIRGIRYLCLRVTLFNPQQSMHKCINLSCFSWNIRALDKALDIWMHRATNLTSLLVQSTPQRVGQKKNSLETFAKGWSQLGAQRPT